MCSDFSSTKPLLVTKVDTNDFLGKNTKISKWGGVV